MPLSPQADQLIDTFLTVAFDREPKVKLDPDLKLRRVINASPWLTQLVERNTAHGKLVWTVAHENERLDRISTSAPFSHEVRVPRTLLTTLSDRSFDGGPATFLLGRELCCAGMANDLRQSRDDFERALAAVASSANAEHDYTSAIERHLAQFRRHEASAQAFGWNAVVGAVRNERDPERIQATLHPTWARIYQRSPQHMASFIEVEGAASPRHSIALDLLPCLNEKTLYMSGKQDLEPIGHRYFKGTVGLAHNDNPYYNQYAADAISRAILFEQYRNPPRKGGPFHYMSIDMERLKLLPELVQRNGIDLHDLRYPMPYIDKRGGQSTYREFALSGNAPQEAELRLDDKDHSDRVLYKQARAALDEWSRQKWVRVLRRELGQKPQKSWDEDELRKRSPELPQILEQMLEWELKIKLEKKLEQMLEQRPQLTEASKPELISGPQMEPRPKFEPRLEMEQAQALWDESWLEMEPDLELSISMDTAETIGLEQKLEQGLEQKLEQEHWRREWQQLALDPEQGLDPWHGPRQQLWDELWQEQKQELARQTLYPQDRRSDNLAAALVAEARHAGLHRIDMIEMVDKKHGGRTVLAVQKPCGTTPVMHATVDYPQALYITIDESSERWEEQKMQREWTLLPTRQEVAQDQAASPLLSEPQAKPVRQR